MRRYPYLSWAFRAASALLLVVAMMVATCVAVWNMDLGYNAEKELSSGSPVLMDDGSIYYLEYDESNSDALGELRRIDPAGNNTSVPAPPNVEGECNPAGYTTLRRLPDGRLGGIDPWGCGEETAGSVAIDGTSGRAVLLGSAYGGLDVLWLGGFQSGWVERYGSGDCLGFGPMNTQGQLPFPDYTPQHLLSWPLDNVSAKRECTAAGYAGFLELAADGRLYFLASSDNVRWNLYGLDHDPSTGFRSLRQYGGGYTQPRDIAVSADGRHVVVSASRDGKVGLWSVESPSGRVMRLRDGSFGDISASARENLVIAMSRREVLRIPIG